MGFTETRALDIYYGEDRKPRDINGKQIGFIGEDIKGGHLATQINFHFEEGDIGEHGAVVIIAKRADGQMRFDLCSKSGTGTSAYYYAELNNWYLEKHGSLILDVKAYTNDTTAAVTIVDDVLTPATGTKIIVGTTFTFDVKYAPLPTTQVSATELSTIELILLAVQSKPDFVDIVKVSVSLPSDLGDTPNEYDGRWFLINDGKDGILYYIDGDTPIEANIGTTIAKLLDCDIDSLASGDVLLWNGTKWENSTRLATAEITIASNTSRIGTNEGNINNHEGRLTTAEETLEILVDTGGIEVNKYDTLGDFPATGSDLRLYLARDTDKLYHWETDAYEEVSNDVNIDSAVDKGVVFYDATLGKIDTISSLKTYLGGLQTDEIYSNSDANTYISATPLGNYHFTIRGDRDNSASILRILNNNQSSTGKIVSFWSKITSSAEEVAYIEKDGTFVTNKNVELGGNLNIAGNIIQQGSSYETHAEQVYTTDDTIILRDGAVGGLAVGSYAGLVAKLADGTNDAWLVFDGNGIAKVGDVGSLQVLATRQDSPTSNGIAYWNASAYRFDTSANFVVDTDDNANAGLTINKSAGAGNIANFQFGGANKLEITKDGFINQNGTSILSVSATNRNAIGLGAVASDNNSVVLGNTDITKTILRGNVGIGTISPTSQLHIVSSATDKVGLIVDSPTGQTGRLQEWRVNGTALAYITSGGTMLAGSFSTSGGLLNSSSYNNAYVEVLTTGTRISRNIADAYTALIVNQAHASSIGKILELQFAGTTKSFLDIYGYFKGQGIRNYTSSNNGDITLYDNGVVLTRSVADANNTYAALKINNQQGNGDIVKFQYGGNSYLRIDKDGNIRASERALIISSEEGASLTLSTSGDSYLDSGISNLYLDGGRVIVSADLELDAKLKDYANSTGTSGQVLKVNATGYPEWKSPKPTDTLLGSKSTTGLIDFGTDDIYNYDEIIVELVFNNSPEFIKTRTMIPSSELVYDSEEPTIAVLGFDGTNVIRALVSTTAAAGDELNVAAISADCSVNIYGRNY